MKTSRSSWSFSLSLSLSFSILSLVVLVAPSLAGGRTDSSSAVQRVDAVGLVVSDMERALDFYSEVLSFEKQSDTEVAGDEIERLQGLFGVRLRLVRMRLGDEHIDLIEYLAPRGRPIPVDARSNDLWFQHVAIVVSDMDAAYAHLRRHQVQHASPSPQRLPDWNPAAGGIRAFYFKDPDGRPLEILEFPPGKGDPRWHAKAAGSGGAELFLGIDHTAIVVSDTDRSLAFYRDTLGLRVAGGSENYGPEQERLNNVFGARLRITALRASSGPGIELLEYLTPRDGRPYPRDARTNDLIHWQTSLVAKDATATAALLAAERAEFISPGVVEIDLGPTESSTSFSRGFLVRDPDGHALRIVELDTTANAKGTGTTP